MTTDVPTLDFDEEADGLESVLNDLGGEGDPVTIRIYKAPGGANRQQQFCFELTAEEFDLASLAEQLRCDWGGGNYRVMVRQRGKIKFNKPLAIAEPIKPRDPVAAPQPPAPGVDLDRILDRMNSMMLESQNSMMKLLIGQGGNKSDSSFSDMIEVAKLLTGNRIDPMEQMQRMLEVQRLMRDDMPGEKQDFWSSAMSGIVGPLAQLAQQAGNTPQGGHATLPRPPAPAKPPASNPEPGQQNAPTAPPKQQAAPAMNPLMALRQFLPVLLRGAANDSDPVAYAQVMVDSMPPELLQMVLMLAQQPAAVDQLGQLAPEVLEHRDWFVELLGELAGLTSEMGETDDFSDVDDEPPHATGHHTTDETAGEADPGQADDHRQREAGRTPDAGADAPDGAIGEN